MDQPKLPYCYGDSTVFSDNLTVREALAQAGLDWTVTKKPLFYREETPTLVNFNYCPGIIAVVREDSGTVMGGVGDNYAPIQNLEAFSVVDEVVEQGLARITAAGSLKGGRIVWMYLDVGESVEVFEGDEIAPRLVLVKSHDSSSSFRAIPMAVRMQCTNVVPSLIRSGKMQYLSIRHSGNTHIKLEQAEKAIEFTYAAFQNYVEAMKRFTERPVHPNELLHYQAMLFPPTETKTGLQVTPQTQSKRNTFKDLWNRVGTPDDPNSMSPALAGTAYAAYQCATYYANHSQPVASTEVDHQSMRWNRMLTSAPTHTLLGDSFEFFLEEEDA